MKLIIFSVRDRATNQFGTPMFLVSVGQAIRAFGDEINKKDATNQLSVHPEDFDLYELGSWDSDTSVFDAHQPKMVGVGKDLVIKS